MFSVMGRTMSMFPVGLKQSQPELPPLKDKDLYRLDTIENEKRTNSAMCQGPSTR